MNVKQKLHLVAAGSLLLVGMQAHAGVTSDVLTVYDPNGSIYRQVFATEDDEAKGLFFLIPDAGLADPTQKVHFTQVVDPDGTVGDIFGVGDFSDPTISSLCNDPNHACLQFISTSEGGDLGPPITGDPNFPIVHEDVYGVPNVWNATMYLNQTSFPGYTATFSSVDIPEPTSLALAGLGGLAMSFARRASRKRS